MIRDSEVFGARSAAISYGAYTAESLDVHSSRDGLLISSNVDVRNSWIHDIERSAVRTRGGSGTVLAGNLIVAPARRGAAALDMRASSSNITGWLVQGNTLEGGQYTVSLSTRRGRSVDGLALVSNVWTDQTWQRSPIRATVPPTDWYENRTSTGDPVRSDWDDVLQPTTPTLPTSDTIGIPETSSPPDQTSSSTTSPADGGPIGSVSVPMPTLLLPPAPEDPTSTLSTRFVPRDHDTRHVDHYHDDYDDHIDDTTAGRGSPL